MWRLETADCSWAVKVSFHRTGEVEVRLATEFQEAAYAADVPTPQVRRTTEGRVFATVAARQVRVYSWVDLEAPDCRLDPQLVGALKPKPRSPNRADGAAWTAEVLDEPHTRELLDTFLAELV